MLLSGNTAIEGVEAVAPAFSAVFVRGQRKKPATSASAPAAFDYVVLHPIPNPPTPDDAERGYTARVAREILPAVRRALTAAG